MTEKREIKKVFVDIDGVLADFATEVLLVHNAGVSQSDCIDVEAFMSQWPRGEFEMWDRMGYESVGDFWEMIAGSPSFWNAMTPYPWATQLMLAARVFGDVSILSSPSGDPKCWSGKKSWRDAYFPATPLILCKEKELIATPDRLLIDDRDEGVDKWRDAGGQAILFPRLWNSNHEWEGSPMVYLGMELAKFQAKKACQ